ncbi:MAG: transcription-repair coupling factor [Calditrichaeota bacterium]|nr:transcription-repair coupling factor [Calditrichota bacterium]
MDTSILKQRLRNFGSYQELAETLRQTGLVSVKSVAGSLRALLVATLAEDTGRPILYVCAEQEDAAWQREDLRQFLGENVVFFPESRSFAHLAGTGSPLELSQRAEALQALINGEARVVATGAVALAQKLPVPAAVGRQMLELAVGMQMDFEALPERLADMGYVREDLVESPGEFSVRGGIIDVYPPNRRAPVRVEFFGDEIESLREFRPDDQRSTAQLERVLLFPPSAAEMHGTAARAATLLDYMPENTLVVLDEPALIRAEIEKAREKGLEGLDRGRTVAVEDPERIFELFELFPRVHFYTLYAEEGPTVEFGARRQETLGGDFKRLAALFDEIRSEAQAVGDEAPYVAFACENRSHRDRMLAILEDEDIDLTGVHVVDLPVHQGFCLPGAGLYVLTSHEFYGRVRRRPQATDAPKLAPWRRLRALQKGDFVVHTDYGIGRFEGMEKIQILGSERECVVLSYEGGDRVYVPLERMDRIEKYSSREGAVPKLSRLGTAEWERLKHRTKERAKELARELIRTNAERKLRAGHAFSPDNHWQRELEASFPFEETPDQVRAIEEVKRDMESPQPMERLVCGDTGYGKTEVAVRAAFKAVNDGKQVAVLVPTTVLAEQHFQTFQERLQNFPVKVEVLSRFRTRKEQTRVLEGLRKGLIDIVIGTHRLLSKDVVFKDLGLLIIDEEQHFGVRQKEKLKKLKATVDVLLLSATPIPRTLQMALMGARDLSVISTPPRDRLPIHTEVLPFDREIIRKAILREVDRGGQVFFVHNRVRSIQAVVGMLRRLVPEVDFGMAHGQMKAEELERVMMDFLDRKFHCLVSTVIIESGLDMPNVNTLIVNRADRFGLAQLYQLRGRVGRSSVKAYAYLLTPPIETLTEEAIKRLQAIAELTELGAGFHLAMRDLEIRGAGNLLGPEQSGFIDALGFDLYTKLIEQAVQELRAETGQVPELTAASEIETRVEIEEDAYLPEEYIPLADERVDFYRRLVRAADPREVEEIREELRDRFGRLPEPALNLLAYVNLKLLGGRLGVERIQVKGDRLLAWFAEATNGNGREVLERVKRVVEKSRFPVELVGTRELGFRAALPKKQPRLLAAEQFFRDVQR